MGVLLSGWAFRYQTLPDGKRQILDFIFAGSLVGWCGLTACASPSILQKVPDQMKCCEVISRHVESSRGLQSFAAGGIGGEADEVNAVGEAGIDVIQVVANINDAVLW